jgi:hypothetical protein
MTDTAKIEGFLSNCRAEIDKRNYAELGSLLRLPRSLEGPEISPPNAVGRPQTRKKSRAELGSRSQALMAAAARMDSKALASMCKTANLGEDWQAVVQHFLQSLALMEGSEFSAATSSHLALLAGLTRIFEKERGAVLSAVYPAVEDCWWLCRQAAGSADAQLHEETARAIHRIFTTCINDRTPFGDSPLHTTRKAGAFKLASQLLRIYFHLGQLNLINNVLRAMQAVDLLAQASAFPKAHTTSFGYFLGRYWLSKDELGKAEDVLDEAYARCRRDCLSQRRAFLRLLIPVKLVLHGLRPNDKQLRAMFMQDRQADSFFSTLLRIIRQGVLSEYEPFLLMHRRRLVREGTFSLYQRLIQLVIKHRIRRIHTALERETRIPIAVLSEANASMDIEDLECLVAGLIARGQIRGYLAQERGYLVLSEKNPFPTE